MGRTAPRITWIIISTIRVQPSLQTFGTIFGTRKLFSKKYTHAGSIVNTTLPACYIYHFTLQIHKSSAQNLFRAEDLCSIIIEAHQNSHRKPTDVLEISLFSSMLALIPQSGDFSGATLGVRSVALRQVPKLAARLFPKMKK